MDKLSFVVVGIFVACCNMYIYLRKLLVLNNKNYLNKACENIYWGSAVQCKNKQCCCLFHYLHQKITEEEKT